MDLIRKRARIAGLLYLVVVFSGVFGLMVLPGKLLVMGDAAATAAKILANETLFRIHMFNGLLASILFLSAVLALYRLLRDVNPFQAMLMLILVAVQTPLGILGVMHQASALDALKGVSYWAAFDQPQREALAMSLLDLDNRGIPAIAMLWGLWLFPLAMLVWRSRILPRFVAIFLALNGIAYVVLSKVGIFWPEHYERIRTILFPAMFGELVLTLSLLFAGFGPKARGTAASAS